MLEASTPFGIDDLLHHPDIYDGLNDFRENPFDSDSMKQIFVCRQSS